MGWNDLLNTQTQQGNKEEVKYTKLNVGITKLRILDDEPYTRYTHWIQSANAGKGSGVDCIGRDCPVCAEIRKAKSQGAKSKYSNTRSNAINVYNYNTGEVEILDKGMKIFQAIATIASQMGDPKNYDINITRTGEGFGNITYNVLPVFPPTEMSDEVKAKAENKYNIREIRKPLNMTQVQMLIDGKSIADVTKTEDTQDNTPSQDDSIPQIDFGGAV